MKNIHETNEEALVKKTNNVVEAIHGNSEMVRQTTKAVESLKDTLKDKTETIAGFTGVINSQKKHGQKLEEIKSANLATNIELKKITKAVSREIPKIEFPKAPEFPKEMEVSIKGLSVVTLKGDKGERGEDGKIGREGAQGVPGKDGKDGKKGRDGKDGQNGTNGKDGERGLDGKNGSPDSPDQVIEKINLAKKKIKAKKVEGLERIIKAVDDIGTNPVGNGGGSQPLVIRNAGTKVSDHVTDLDFSTGLSAVYSNNGIVTLTSTGGLSQAAADLRYLKLDASNDPLTGDLNILKTNPLLRVTDNAGSINYAEMYANSLSAGFNFSIIDGESSGGIDFDGLVFSLNITGGETYIFTGASLTYLSGTISSTQMPFSIIGDRAFTGTNTNGGEMRLIPGDVTGSGTANTVLYAAGGGASGTTVHSSTAVATFAYNRATVVTPITCTAINTGNGDVELAAGTYTPTRSAETNLDSNVTVTQAQYSRVGNVVSVSGRFTANPTTAAVATSFELTLPIASNLGAAEDCAGTAFCGAIAGMGAEVIGSAANNTAKIQWIASDINSQTWSYNYTYEII